MSILYSIHKNRTWFDIIKDGNSGEAGRIRTTFNPIIVANTFIYSNNKISISVFYYDNQRNMIRRLIGRDPEMVFQDIENVSVVKMEGYTYLNGDYIIYYIDTNNIFNTIGTQGIDQIPLSDLDPNPLNNVNMKKAIGNTTTVFLLSMNTSIYLITGLITFTSIISDYDGIDFSVYIDDSNQEWYLSYTSNGTIKIIKYKIQNFTVTGNITYSPGRIGNCAYFNNVVSSSPQNYIKTPNNQKLPLSISFWFNTSDLTEYQTIIGLTNSLLNDPSIQFDLDSSGNLLISISLPSQWSLINLNTPVLINTWNHLCLTIDENFNARCYLNGIFSESVQGTNDFQTSFTTFILGGSGDSARSFIGYIDEFCVYNRVLNQSEVTSLYNLNTIGYGRINYLPLESSTIDPAIIQVASLNSPNFSLPRVIVNNNVLSIFVQNLNDTSIYSTNLVNNQLVISNRLRDTINYSVKSINNEILIDNIGPNNKISQLKIVDNKVQSEFGINIKNHTIINSAFESININNEQYIYYIDTNYKLHQLWNPIQQIDIKINDIITGLTADVTNNGSLFPSFSMNIRDYGITTGSMTDKVQYNITLTLEQSGSTTITNWCYPNQLLKLFDFNNNKYFIKIYPNYMLLASTNIIDSVNYQPGYYLAVDTFGSNCPYYLIYNSSGLPVWYRRNTSDPDLINNPQICALTRGNNNNKVITYIFDFLRVRTVIDVTTLDEENFQIVPDSRGGNPGWDVHESFEIKRPLYRKGNVILVSYTNPFYIQELSPNNELVWDWFGSDYLVDPGGDYYHINSIDVHPVTGHLVLSARNNSTVFSIDYHTKNIRWVINPTLGFINFMNSQVGVHILIPTNEPTNPNNYDGTSAQHDARWHTNITPLTSGNEIVSIYDNGSFNGFNARGVIYEIDLNLDQALFRGMVYGPATSGYMGSYKIIDENNGSRSHVCDWVQSHPCLGEYSSDANNMPTQNQLFNLDIGGDHYRFDKAKLTDLSITGMRKTSGMPYTTP